jgi:single-strand DNA-binding protein
MQIRNSITLIGNVGQNPEVINAKNGNEFLRFSLATNDRYTDRDGKRIERTEWHTVMVFGKQVEYIKNNVTKGEMLAVSGVLRYSNWTDKLEQKRTSAAIHLESYTFLSSKKELAEVAA